MDRPDAMFSVAGGCAIGASWLHTYSYAPVRTPGEPTGGTPKVPTWLEILI
jgi:hypothetical protein